MGGGAGALTLRMLPNHYISLKPPSLFSDGFQCRLLLLSVTQRTDLCDKLRDNLLDYFSYPLLLPQMFSHFVVVEFDIFWFLALGSLPQVGLLHNCQLDFGLFPTE
jgi:hypothetical protein